MIPLKDDIPTLNKPIVRNYILATYVIVFILQIMSPSYSSGELFYSYGLIPSVLFGNQQLPENIYAIPAIATIFTSMSLSRCRNINCCYSCISCDREVVKDEIVAQALENNNI